ncbi:hypothetical protein BRADI_1g00455v3 [Brachypodium distachyon]|uniref:Uncharacterized protein n=1 Tax=Brachypodium distachyon TaxID=15368 RepID=A0A2K2DHG0_BRADI|nr:hypothetical protein BRADI_1g00455v3 [Brachypodium distachyon]
MRLQSIQTQKACCQRKTQGFAVLLFSTSKSDAKIRAKHLKVATFNMRWRLAVDVTIVDHVVQIHSILKLTSLGCESCFGPFLNEMTELLSCP